MSWSEVRSAWERKDAASVVFEAPQVLARVDELDDLFAPALSLRQRLRNRSGVVLDA